MLRHVDLLFFYVVYKEPCHNFLVLRIESDRNCSILYSIMDTRLNLLPNSSSSNHFLRPCDHQAPRNGRQRY